MYKSRLQELCHQRLWALPEYTSIREGSDHNPRFRGTVTVNGVSFYAADLSKTSKEAQNKAAQAAFEHFAFASASPTPPPLRPSPAENQMPYKNQLQTFAQRKNVDLPIYTYIREGVPHASRFKATVTVNGKDFESSQYFSTLKEAEHDAAKVALMSSLPEENQQGETGFYKNLLQELAHKEGFSLPKYTTVRDGACHKPSFSSTVEVEGESFEGDVANTKKQAETNAAKVAWCTLNERKLSKLPSGLPSGGQLQKEPSCVVSSSESAVVMNLHKPRDVSVPVSQVKIDKVAEVASDKLDSTTADSVKALPDNQKTHSPSGLEENDDSFNDQSSATVQKLKDPEITMMKAATDTELPNAEGTCSLLCNRIRVYPRKPDLVLPQGATLLPFSDDMWVAVSLDFSNHEGNSQDRVV